MKKTLTLDIGGTNFSVALFEDRSLVRLETQATLRDAGPVWMLDRMEEMVTAWNAGPFNGCGIGFGGPVNFFTQRVIYSTHVSGWNDFDLCGEVKRRFATPAVIDRDSLAGALGEGIHGAGRGMRPIFYITLSTGIGGGLLTDGGLLRGADSFACELGHHIVVPNGPECLCGSYGCLERMCSGLWLERDYGKSAEELMRDPAFVEKYVVHLAQGLKNTIMFLNPARIIIGGGIATAGDALFVPLRKELAKQMPPWSRARMDVVPAALGRETIAWGALELAYAELY
ncbi:ROK family protein [Silvibacterium acidisoli]|uniref:ROK family protein n=1 Tax=Acidobacteriaceae bacterium ZG23-2 TaxID=2883246 RepID=UPI00406C61E0